MSIANRIEKLLFLTQEIELANLVALAQPSDYLKRASARRVIVRVKDFITHVAQLPKPLKLAGLDSSELKARKEVYAKEFAAYFQTQRDRMAAHVQDVDLIERLELWTDIEVTKLSYFVDGAREIYVESLGAVGSGDYQPFASFPELSDPGFAAALAAHARSLAAPTGVTLDVGSFAASFPDTVTIIEGTPVQQRAAQLLTLQQWMRTGAALHERVVATWPNAERLIRAQLLTDAVSFADCLVTRVDAGTAQQMTGLDDLVRAVHGDASAVEELLQVFHFSDKLNKLRAVRNVVGGHVDDDENVSLRDLLCALDGASPREILRFHSKLAATFELTCRRTFFLEQYLHSGVRLAGIVSAVGGHEYVRPFDPAAAPSTHMAGGRVRDHSDEAIGWAIEASARGEAWGRDVLWDAFGAARVVERCERDGGAFEFRAPHELLLQRLCVPASCVEERVRLLNVVRSCARGWPEPLAELLTRCLDVLHERGDHAVDAAIYGALGELPLSHDGRIRERLIEAAGDADADTARAAHIALYRLVVHAELRAKSWPATLFGAHIQPLLANRPAEERLLVGLVIASLLPAGKLHVESEDAERELTAIQPVLRAHLGESLGDPTVEKLLTVHDYVSLAVLVARRFVGTDRDGEGRAILGAVIRGEIVLPAGFDRRAMPLANLALACIDAGERDRAKRIASGIMTAFPSNVLLKLHGISLLLAAGVAPEVCDEMLDYVVDAYVLDAKAQTQLDTVRREIMAARTGSST